MREPESIGVIPDGNRRYARKYGITYAEAYKRGIETAKRALDFVVEETKTRYVQFYTLSLENLKKRGETELKILFKLFERELKNLLTNNPWDARIVFGGRLHLLPRSLRKLMDEVVRKTENNDGINVGLLVAYTGMAEVVDVIKGIARLVKEGLVSPDEIDEELIQKHLYIQFPFPDFILRTSGEKRLSGFLPIQSVYSELIFYPKFWPEMTYSDFQKVYEEYSSRERRFGK